LPHPGSVDDDGNALWCWDEQEHDGVPPENKTLSVAPGSVLTFDFGGKVEPDHVVSGAAPISYGRLTGAAPTDLRVDGEGRTRIPEDLRAGEYAVGVFVSGPQGEADYSVRVAVEGDASERPGALQEGLELFHHDRLRRSPPR
jgi:hypothetical protein